jgi:hypothetical protein
MSSTKRGGVHKTRRYTEAGAYWPVICVIIKIRKQKINFQKALGEIEFCAAKAFVF